MAESLWRIASAPESSPLNHPRRYHSVLLADNHSPMLEGIRTLLGERFEAVLMMADVRSLLEGVMRLQPDLAIVDVSFPHKSGGNVIDLLHARFPDLTVIALSAFADRTVTDRILASGAAAVVFKSSAVIDLGPALDAVGCSRPFAVPLDRL
jgi:DNA-binding NarL/FixJ family response regulator